MVYLGHAYLFIISIYLLFIYLFIYRYKNEEKKNIRELTYHKHSTLLDNATQVHSVNTSGISGWGKTGLTGKFLRFIWTIKVTSETDKKN